MMKRGSQLPWRMTFDEWERFKLKPESFLTPEPELELLEARCTGCGAMMPREDLIFFDEHTRYCESCMETI